MQSQALGSRIAAFKRATGWDPAVALTAETPREFEIEFIEGRRLIDRLGTTRNYPLSYRRRLHAELSSIKTALTERFRILLVRRAYKPRFTPEQWRRMCEKLWESLGIKELIMRLEEILQNLNPGTPEVSRAVLTVAISESCAA